MQAPMFVLIYASGFVTEPMHLAEAERRSGLCEEMTAPVIRPAAA